MPQTENSAGTGSFAERSRPAVKAGTTSARPGDLSECGDLNPALFELFELVTRLLEAGEPVDEEQLVAEHPEWAREIRTLLPTLRGMAQAGALVSAESASPSAGDDEQNRRRVVGDFRIVREIGRGGMGIVYEAEQAALGRRVALKVLPQAAALDPRAIERFQLEAQVAGWLQHPRIVPVYAVGRADDVPYFAMQLIEGGSLGHLIVELRRLAEQSLDMSTDQSTGDSPSALALRLLTGRFAPSSRLTDVDRRPASSSPDADMPAAKAPPSIGGAAYPRTVARLGIQAAEALGYAHEQGVVHRDIKPANLLLDRRGDLWVADFGMADVQGDAGLTLSGDLPGTLRYMSPEQATGQRAIVDRRTDIYSLGATLYELLTLQPAIAGPDKAEIIRKIAEEEPVPIRRLNPAVPVDLATIVTKAISKDPANRYETALKLADDLDRFLDGRPIAARPVGPLLRSWRWCLRKPVQAGLAAALAVALVGGFAGITWNWRDAVRQKHEAERQKLVALDHEEEAVRQKQEAERQKQEALRQKGLLVVSQGRAEASEKKALTLAAKADAINNFFIDKLLRQAAPENNPAAKRVTLLEVLDRASAQVGKSFRGQPEVEAAIRVTLGQTYHDLGDFAKSAMHYRAAYDIHRQQSDETGQGKLDAMSNLGHSLVHLGRLEEADPLLAGAVEEARRVLGPTHELTQTTIDHLANLHFARGRLDDAEALERRRLDDCRLARGPKDRVTVAALNNLGTILFKEKKYGEAERLYRECLAIRRELAGSAHPDTITCLHNLGIVLDEVGRVEEAEKLMRECFESSRQVLGAEHPRTLERMSALGSALSKIGRPEDAETLLRPCLEAQRRVIGPNHPETLRTAAVLDAVVKKRTRAAEANAPPDVPTNPTRPGPGVPMPP